MNNFLFLKTGLLLALVILAGGFAYVRINRGYYHAKVSSDSDFHGWMVKPTKESDSLLVLEEKTFWDLSPKISSFKGKWEDDSHFKGEIFDLTIEGGRVVISYSLEDEVKTVIYELRIYG